MWKVIIQIGLKLVIWWMERAETKAQTKKQFLNLIDELTGQDHVGDLRLKYHAQLSKLQERLREQERQEKSQ